MDNILNETQKPMTIIDTNEIIIYYTFQKLERGVSSDYYHKQTK